MSDENDKNKIGCCVCGAEHTVVCLDGENYCAKCYNLKNLKEYGIDEDFEHPELMMVTEPDGTMHSFNISHLVYGGAVHWEAGEIEGSLHIEHASYIHGDIKKMLDSFYAKIKQTVLTKTIEKRPAGKEFISNELYRDDYYYSLKDRGTITICQLDDDSVGFMVDGEKFTPDEFALMCGPFTGWNLLYQVQEVADGPLGSDEVLMRWRMSKKLLVQELKDLLKTVVNKNNKIMKSKMKQFDFGFMTICMELSQYKNCDYGEARDAADEMRVLLQAVSADDAEFPEKQLELLDGAVVPWEWDS